MRALVDCPAWTDAGGSLKLLMLGVCVSVALFGISVVKEQLITQF